MYCIKCGVELQNGVERCPLCGLRVYHPDLSQNGADPKPYPRYTEGAEKVRRGGLLFVITMLLIIPVLICFLTDLKMNGKVTWSGFAAGGLLICYVSICLPLWFRKNRSVIFFPIAAACAMAVTLYVCLKTDGHWFLSFAFPVGGALILLIETVIVLLRYTTRDRPYRALFIFGGLAIAIGGLCMLIEFLLHITFSLPMQWWCLYPLSVLAVVGLTLIVIGLFPALRESLYRKFFI